MDRSISQGWQDVAVTSADELLAALDPEQREVALAVGGPVCVLAGAGTGKTRAITHRIAYAVATGRQDPSRTLALTFTARAASEMRSRLRLLGVAGVQTRTFHAAALRQLRYFWTRIESGGLPTLAASKAPFIGEAVKRMNVSGDALLIRDLASQIEWAKVSEISHEDFAIRAQDRLMPGSLDQATVARIYRAYEAIKGERGAIDFEDVLLILVGMLGESDEVRDLVRAQYRHFTIDEYQDVSPLQQHLLDMWLGDRTDICVVGDPNQTIYSFAGATPSYLRAFPVKYPQTTTVRLLRDYRSTPQVVALANKLLHGELIGQQPDGPSPRFIEAGDELDEAKAITKEIRQLIADGVPIQEIAILYRTNGQSERFESALADEGIAYQVRGGERFFDRREVKEAIRLFRGAAVARNDASISEEVGSLLSAIGWSETAPQTGGAARERWESLAALVALAEEIAAGDPEATMRTLVDELDERDTAQHAPMLAGVTLASFHAAKGLEWDAVFLVGLTDGLLPISYAQTPEAIEEEKRLLYVGITRARFHLFLSWPTNRGRGSVMPSRFLNAIRPSSPKKPAVLPAPKGVATCRLCGRALRTAAERKSSRCLHCPSLVDPVLLDRLKAWRLETANSASVPAFVVFTDATLAALAELKPTSQSQLLAIPGIGASKAEKYGPALFDLLAE
jgi:DNA helicase II / ATP-dependent DNA helicase PcrA